MTGSPTYAPYAVCRAPNAMVSSVDNLASAAGLRALSAGGSAVDAAVAANAVLSVTLPNQCGLGGDLFALVHRPGEPPLALNASGRSGSGADPAALRAGGFRGMPPKRQVASVTVPGCADGWLALHDRFGRLALADLLAPAIGYARDGFPASPYRRVEQLRAQQRATPPPGPDKHDPDQPSSVIRTLTSQLADLKRLHREETAQLRQALEAAHGEIIDLRRRLGPRAATPSREQQPAAPGSPARQEAP